MSDENSTNESAADENPFAALDEMDAAQLRDRHTELHTRRAEILGGSLLNKATRAELNAINAELTKIVELVNELESPIDEVPDLPDAPKPAAEVKAEDTKADEPAPSDVAADAISRVSNIREPELQAASLNSMSEKQTPARPAAKFRVASATGGEQGPEISDADLGRMILTKADGLNGRSGEEFKIASVQLVDDSFLEIGTLAPGNSKSHNARIITEAMRRHAAVAEAGGVRAAAVGTPLVVRDVPDCFAIENPLLGLIAPVPGVAERRGCEITYQKPHTKADLAAGVKLWTAADQAAITSDEATWKPVVVPSSPGVGQITAVSVPVGYTPERCYDSTNPEAVANDLHILRSIQNDIEVSYLLGRIDAEASRHGHTATAAATASTGFGAVVETIGVLNAWKGYVRSLGLASRGRGTIVAEAGAIEAIAYDMVAANESLVDDAAEQIRAMLGKVANLVEVTVQAPGQTDPWAGFIAGLTLPGAAATAFPAAPSAFRFRWFDPSGWFRIAPTNIEFGIRDDFNSERKNRIPYFGENFHGAGTLACAPSLSIDMAFGNWGGRSARAAATTPPLYTAA